MHKIFLISGRTCSGKSSIVKAVAEIMQMNVLKSYTTRPKRLSEQIESDHIHIPSESVTDYADDIVAYTKIGEYEYFCTLQQLIENDFYVIDIDGINYLKKSLNDAKNIRLTTIYIQVNPETQRQRCEMRKDNIEVFKERIEDEDEQFSRHEANMTSDYVINNDGELINSVDEFIRIITSELMEELI